jgi:type IV secretion system pilin
MIELHSLLASANSVITDGLNQACGTACNTGSTLPQILGNVADTLIFIIGAVSVIMIIVGGLRYVISNGDPKNASAAKDTILYAVIGVVVSIAAFAIVKFVITNIH